MRLVRTGVYRCTICDDIIFAATDAPPSASFVDSGSGYTERIITVRDVEVHRCVWNGDHASSMSGLTLFEHRRTRLAQ